MVVELAGKAAETVATDTSYKITAGVVGTELNGVNVKFDSLTETGAATALTSTWDALSTKTLTVTGRISLHELRIQQRS